MVQLCMQGWTKNQTADLGEELFGAYVRQGDLTQQKNFALDLYGKFKNPKYMLWSNIATVLQGRSEKNPTKKTILNNLSVKLFENYFTTQNVTVTEQQLLFFVNMLVEQGQHQKALEVVEGELGKALKLDHQKQELIGSLLVKIGLLDKAKLVYKELIKNNAENWTWFTCLLDVCVELSGNPEKKNRNSRNRGIFGRN